jgi:enoyl-CoA hydratase
MTHDAVGYRQIGAVAVVTLDNPPLNLQDSHMREALDKVMSGIAQDAGIRAVVLTSGDPLTFSAGSDLSHFSTDWDESVREARETNRCYDAIESLPQPTVAALEGHALGGGVELALACDLRVAASNVILAFPETGLGVFAGNGATLRLPELIGPSRAKEILFFGDSIRAREARRIGLVNVVVPAGKATECALGLAERLAALPALAVQVTKRVVNARLGEGRGSARRLEERLIGEIHVSHDASEGVRAFLEKRTPAFTHS